MIALNLTGAHQKLSHFSLRIFATLPFFPHKCRRVRFLTVRARFSVYVRLRLINIESTCCEKKVNIVRVTLLALEKSKEERATTLDRLLYHAPISRPLFETYKSRAWFRTGSLDRQACLFRIPDFTMPNTAHWEIFRLMSKSYVSLCFWFNSLNETHLILYK